MHAGPSPTQTRPMQPWHFVLCFGLVSLLADMVYEGARSIIGPYLATLGASAALVGLVAGAAEFIGYGMRVVTGYAVQRRANYWTWTIVGYALTVLSVPLIGSTSAIAPALLLYGTERLGKAVRSPAKDTMLSHVSAGTGRGTAFGVHQALDQTGAVLGPLLLAAVLSWREDDYRLAFAVLLVPGLMVLGLLFWLRARLPNPVDYEPAAPARAEVTTSSPPRRLPGVYWKFVTAVAMLSFGVASFPLLAFHAQTTGLVAANLIPVLFAVAMAVDGAIGVIVGWAYDRRGSRVLLAVPVAAAGAAIAFSDQAWLVWLGVGIWGVVNGVLDSTVKAVVAELVPKHTRAAAFGWLALVRGLGLLVAGGAIGLAYEQSATLAITVIVVANAFALVALNASLRPSGPVVGAKPPTGTPSPAS